MMCEFVNSDGNICPDVAHQDCVGYMHKPRPTLFFCELHSKIAYDARKYWQKERDKSVRRGSSRTKYAEKLKALLASDGFECGRSTLHDYLGKDTTKFKVYDEQGKPELNNMLIKLYQKRTGLTVAT